MAALGLPLRRLRRQLHRNAGHIIVGAFVVFALITLLKIDYAPATKPAIQPAKVNVELPDHRTTAKDIRVEDAAVKDAAVEATEVKPAAIKPVAIEDIANKGIRVDWSRKAYVQYVASPEDACKAVMLFSELHESFSNALRVLYYPSSWRIQEALRDKKADLQAKAIARLLTEASKEFAVVLQPTDILQDTGNGPTKLPIPLRKFLAFNLTQYDRVIVLDTDSVVSHSMDELFLLPPTPMALPYFYLPEEETWGLSTNLLVIQPSVYDFKRVERFITTKHNENAILDLFEGKLLKLPQRPYHLLSEEFRQPSHSTWLREQESWDAASVLQDAKFVSFWDPPMPGPWSATKEDVNEYLPSCVTGSPHKVGMYRYRPPADCSTRNAWTRLYSDFSNRRRIVCGAGFVPANNSIAN